MQSATVYVWYPHGENVGHASMHIGEASFNIAIETMLHPVEAGSRKGFNASAIKSLGNFSAENYVSWWPDGYGSLTSRDAQARKLALVDDEEAEGSKAHAVYRMLGLNEGAMLAKWRDIHTKPGGSYQLIRKNCSTIVLRVLKAGGAFDKLSPHKKLWFYKNAFVTPKNIAQVCNDLRDGGFALKEKNKDIYPTKEETPRLMRVLGMR